MPRIARHTRAIMLVTGVLTCTMLYAAIAPQAALLSMFGVALEGGALGEILVRSWGLLITLIGAMLIHGAFNPAVRPLVLTVAGLSKLFFVALLLLLGGEFLPKTLTPIVIDSLAVVFFALCLPQALRDASAR
ncbi:MULTISPECIES: hypothetical protein [unclassified Pseudomonas]|uniref:hypothetical protein n=1 Tax=unclassified Pseudomonas TaxID=196821 RepID=UPI0024494A0E|nr:MULTISPECIES: hypothetical protein [unclassified Pseudomonas]MDG9925272.1 hypothetical protein [Pseudomonas sp. GD04045]MDH0036073.1 hypothetical protein [Pseudomonas sp. GD04019]